MGLIYFDACLLIYLVEGHTRWGEPLERAMTAAVAPDFAISSLVKLECLVAPIKRGDPVLERAYSGLFDQFTSLAMPEPVYLQAAQLRARFGIRTPDALHLACAQHHSCEALWTNDDRLTQASHGLALNILR
ncbi:MAG: type II toxin-antitoxin system VapC family toxin [Stellaceae bacterium]